MERIRQIQEDADSPLTSDPPDISTETATQPKRTSYLTWFAQRLRPLLAFFAQPLEHLRRYDTANLQADIIAGLTVAVITLPQAMAYALIAELPPETGLYAAIIGGIVGALWGSSDHLQTGPTNATSLLVLSALLAVAQPGTPEYLVAAGLIAVIVGTLQILMAVARLGVMVNFISDAVIVGFTAGAGVLIGINQLRHLLRLDLPSLPSLWETVPAIITRIPTTHLISFFIGAGTIALIIILRKVNRKLPAPLIAMVGAAVLVALFRLDLRGVKVVGELPQSLPPFKPLPVLDWAFIQKLLTSSVALGAIALVQTISIARSIAAQSGQRLDSNQEFFGQGLANIVSGLFSGYTVAASFTSSAVKFTASAKSGLASVVSSIFVMLALLVFAPGAAYVPLPALAGVLMLTAYGLIDQHEIRRIWRSNHGDRTIMVATMLATLALPLEYAVLMGIALSIVYYLLRTSKPRVRVVLPSDDFRYFTPRPDKPSCVQLGVVEILGDLYFGAVSHIEESIQENLGANPSQRFLLLRMYPVENCDISGIHTLESIVRTYRDRGGDVYFVHVQAQVRALMESTGFYDFVGNDHFLDPDEAVNYLFHKILDPAICIYECPLRVFRYCQNLPKRLDLVATTPEIVYRMDNVPTIAPNALWEALHSPEPPRVIDVREPREFKQAHIPQAEAVPFLEILNHPDREVWDKPTVIVCQGGRRSARATAILHERGHRDVQMLEGGMAAWLSKKLLTAVELRQ